MLGKTHMLSGVTARRLNMTTISSTKAATTPLSIFLMAALGVSIILMAGFAHSATIHDAAHDVRHASGFPCH